MLKYFHHLKELTAIQKILDKNTLVVVDDAPAIGHLERSEENLNKARKIKQINQVKRARCTTAIPRVS